MEKRWIWFAGAILVSVILAVLAVTPTSPANPDTPLDQFSSERAMKDVRIIASKPHPTGSPENKEVRDYIMQRMESMGLEVMEYSSVMTDNPETRYDAVDRLNRWSGQELTEQTIYNVVGVLPGKDRTKPALLLMAHHDTVWDSPGASDDTMGVAVILEIIRALKTEGERERDLVVLITDAEELGLVGARNFFDKNPHKDKIGTIINFEARGAGGTSNLFQLHNGDGEAAKLYSRVVNHPSASSLSAFIYNLLPNDTDLTPALAKDYTAYNIAIIGRAGYYHSPKITPDALDEGSLQHMGSQGLDLTRALLDAPGLPQKSSNKTFFDVFGLFVLIYSPFWGWIFILAGVGAFVQSARRDFKVKEMVDGALKMVLFTIGVGVALLLLNLISGYGKSYEGLNKGVVYYDRLAAIPALQLTALITCLSGFFLIFGSRKYARNFHLGMALPVILLAVIGQALAPTATYFLSVPVLLIGLAALFKTMTKGNLTRMGSIILVIPVLGYMLGLGHLILLGVGPDMLSVAVIPAIVAVLALALIWPEISKIKARNLSIILLMMAVILALWIRLDPVADTVPTYQVW